MMQAYPGYTEQPWKLADAMYTGIKNSKSVNGSYHLTGGSFFAHPYLQYKPTVNSPDDYYSQDSQGDFIQYLRK